MRCLFIWLAIFILFLSAIEHDRTFYITHNPYNFYIKHFPQQIGYGIFNTYFRNINNTFLFKSNHMLHEYFLNIYHHKIKREIETSGADILKISIPTHSISPDLPKNDAYRIILFKKFNYVNIEMLTKFPSIQEYLGYNRNVKTCFLSIMNDKVLVDWHRGTTNLYLRHHYPIILHKNYECFLEIVYNNKKYKIDYKNPFLFDDTYPHRLVKNDIHLRVVLISDITNYKL